MDCRGVKQVSMSVDSGPSLPSDLELGVKLLLLLAWLWLSARLDGITTSLKHLAALATSVRLAKPQGQLAVNHALRES